MLAILWASVTKILFYIEDYHYDSRTVKSKIWKINSLLTDSLSLENIKNVIKLIESRLPDIYGWARANIYLCDHKRQEIYKIIEEEANNEKLIFFSSQSGLAGKVSNEGKAMIANNVVTYFQFNNEIDDPNGKYHSILKIPEDGVVNILTIPIYWFKGADILYLITYNSIFSLMKAFNIFLSQLFNWLTKKIKFHF